MNKPKPAAPSSGETSATLSCGIIMPISPIDGCTAEHWSEVKEIIKDAVESIAEPKFTAKLVSDADDIGVIQKRIVHGVYNSGIIVCDVSAKNSNVMFELGMRLAFDKPTVIIKDDKTDYSFDTSIIEHLAYPRDLRFSKIINFKNGLAEKILATYSASTKDAGHSTFLKNFGTFKVAHLSQTEASGEQVILEMLSEIQQELSFVRRQGPRSRNVSRQLVTEDSVKAILLALLDVKKADPALSLEPGEELSKLLCEVRPDIVNHFQTRDEFDSALTLACLVSKDLV
jgi:hypothetical protein